jgi:hypothetical protein
MNYSTMHMAGTLKCCNPIGEPRTFEVRVEEESAASGKKWHFMARPIYPPDPSGECYFATIVEISSALAQVEVTSNTLPAVYHRCGISRSLFPRIASLLNRPLRSSRNPQPTTIAKTTVDDVTLTVFRSEETLSQPALKVWQRLAQDCMAKYDPTEDRFYCSPYQARF